MELYFNGIYDVWFKIRLRHKNKIYYLVCALQIYKAYLVNKNYFFSYNMCYYIFTLK